MALFGRKKEKEEKAKPQPEAVQEKAAPASPPTTGDARSYQIIAKPHMTEKASLLGGFNKYVFRVSRQSNKVEIKRAVESLYKVKVEKVAVLSMPAKQRQVGRTFGEKPGFKKAIVTLAEGHKIDINA